MARPIVATDVPGCRDVVEDGVTGILCEPRDAVSLAKAMLVMVDKSVDQRREMGLAGRRRVEHLRDDPRVTLSALDEASWYTHVSLIGRVTEIADDAGLVDIDRLSMHYGDRPYPHRTSPRVSAWIAVDRWHGWGAVTD